jgi:putative serine protease PepD
VVSGSPADKASLKKWDVIIKFGDKEINTAEELVKAIQSCEVDGTQVEITFVRGEGEPQTTEATLVQRPSPY